MLLLHVLKYLPAQVLSPVAQLASMVLWTHWLAPEQMGLFTLVAVTQDLTYLGLLSWFSIHVLRYLPDAGDAAGRERYLRSESAVLFAAALPTFAVAALASWHWPGGGPIWREALVIGLYFLTRNANVHYAERARAQSAFLAYTLLQTTGPVGGLLVGLLAVHRVAPTAEVLWASYAAAQGLGTLLALPLLGIRLRPARPDVAVLKAALAYGGPFLGLSALGWVAENHLRYLVEWQSGAAALGLMAVGWGLGRRCASVASMLVATASFPIAARLLNEGRRGDALEQLALNGALMLAVLLPVTVGLVMIGPGLVELVVAPEYRGITIDLLGWSAFSGALRCLHLHATDPLMVLERRYPAAAAVDVVEIAACAAASLCGLLWFGLKGAVIGQAIGSAVALALSLYWTSARLGLRWRWADSLRIAGATAAMAAVLAVVPAQAGGVGLAIEAVAGALVYGAGLGLCYRAALWRHVGARWVRALR